MWLEAADDRKTFKRTSLKDTIDLDTVNALVEERASPIEDERTIQVPRRSRELCSKVKTDKVALEMEVRLLKPISSLAQPARSLSMRKLGSAKETTKNIDNIPNGVKSVKRNRSESSDVKVVKELRCQRQHTCKIVNTENEGLRNDGTVTVTNCGVVAGRLARTTPGRV